MSQINNSLPLMAQQPEQPDATQKLARLAGELFFDVMVVMLIVLGIVVFLRFNSKKKKNIDNPQNPSLPAKPD